MAAAFALTLAVLGRIALNLAPITLTFAATAYLLIRKDKHEP